MVHQGNYYPLVVPQKFEGGMSSLSGEQIGGHLGALESSSLETVSEDAVTFTRLESSVVGPLNTSTKFLQ